MASRDSRREKAVESPSLSWNPRRNSRGFRDTMLRPTIEGHRGAVAPGPIYEADSSVGSQALSERANAPAFGLGARYTVPPRAYSTVGPGAHDRAAVNSAVGRQSLSVRPNAPVVAFDRADRWPDVSSNPSDAGGTETVPAGASASKASSTISDPTAHLGKAPFGTSTRWDVRDGGAGPGNSPDTRRTPGPGTYSPGTWTRVRGAGYRSQGMGTFGASSREQRGRVYLTPEHERAMLGSCSPGPATAMNVGGGVSSQRRCLSGVRNARGFKFGGGDRFSQIHDVGMGGASFHSIPVRGRTIAREGALGVGASESVGTPRCVYTSTWATDRLDTLATDTPRHPLPSTLP